MTITPDTHLFANERGREMSTNIVERLRANRSELVQRHHDGTETHRVLPPSEAALEAAATIASLLEALKEAETALRLIENRDQFWPGMESLEIHAEAALKRIRSAIAAATRET